MAFSKTARPTSNYSKVALVGRVTKFGTAKFGTAKFNRTNPTKTARPTSNYTKTART